MKNTFGQSVTVTVFGESHGPYIGAVVDGLAPGLPVEEDRIASALSRRRPQGPGETARQETDDFSLVSGVFDGKTTGTPLTVLIANRDTRSADYTYGVARPSHADYTAYCKYHGFSDYRGGGHFSGRITAALVAVGGILQPALEALGITVGSHILSVGSVRDRPLSDDPARDLALLRTRAFPVLEEAAGAAMQAAVLAAKADGDSVGGVIEGAVCGLPAGLGEPMFDSVEGVLSHALFAIGGVKGVSFGAGFAVGALRGSTCNDAFVMRDGAVRTVTNRSGGINGGITNGMPLVYSCAVRPTPSIAREQKTVDFTTGTDTALAVRGRHDPAIVRRICPVADAVCAMVICDLLAQRYGTDVLKEGLPCSSD